MADIHTRFKKRASNCPVTLRLQQCFQNRRVTSSVCLFLKGVVDLLTQEMLSLGAIKIGVSVITCCQFMAKVSKPLMIEFS